MLGRWWYGPKTAGEIWPKERSVTSFDATEIRYTFVGPDDAPVVALCAGFVCPDTYWRYLVPALRDDHRVLVWNYRGIGVSGLPRDPGYHARGIADDELSIENNARDLEAIVDAERLHDVALVGHSMGCQVVLESYRRRRELFRAIALIAGPYRTPLRTFYRTDLSARLAPIALPFVHLVPRIALVGWRAMFSNPLAYPAGVHVLRAIGPRAKAEDMRGYFAHLATLDPLIVAKMVRGMHDHDASDVLGEIDVPTLILHGTSDPFTPLSVAEHMADTIRGARLVTYDRASHTLPIEHPAEIAGEVRELLRTAFSRP